MPKIMCSSPGCANHIEGSKQKLQELAPTGKWVCIHHEGKVIPQTKVDDVKK